MIITIYKNVQVMWSHYSHKSLQLFEYAEPLYISYNILLLITAILR